LKESGGFLRREFSLRKSAAFFYFGGMLCEIIWKLLPGILQKPPIASENAKSEK